MFMHIKTFTTNSLSDKYEFTNDILFDYEYEGIDQVPYLSQGFNCAIGDENFLILAIDEFKNKIAGAVVITNSPKETLNGTGAKSWINSIGVAEEYLGRKLARQMIHEMFKVCDEQGIDKIEQSSYTDIGQERIRRLFEEIEKEYPSVEYIDVLNVDENSYCDTMGE